MANEKVYAKGYGLCNVLRLRTYFSFYLEVSFIIFTLAIIKQNDYVYLFIDNDLAVEKY